MDRLTAATVDATARTFDLAHATVRELNQFLHRELPSTAVRRVTVENPGGRHAIAAGLDAPVEVDVRGHGGYYLAGMNQHAHVTVHGNVLRATEGRTRLPSGEPGRLSPWSLFSWNVRRILGRPNDRHPSGRRRRFQGRAAPRRGQCRRAVERDPRPFAEGRLENLPL